MAESKGALLAKSVQKHAGRAKEKLLQNLGKVDRTADEIFDEHLTNFNRQTINATRLQKEFNNYIRCVRAVQTASKTLMEAVGEVYEGQWTGSEAVNAQVSAIEVLFADFSHKLGDQVLIPLNTYTAQFPEMKKKIEKRNRKLIDYDGQRHSFQNVQANAAKRKDDVKVTKGREQLEEARRTYEILNSELHDELPALHDSRILFLVTNLQTLFASEQVFHNETAKIYAELEAVVDKLATESQRGSYTLKKSNAINPSSPPQSPIKSIANSTGPIINNNNSSGGGGSGYPSPVTNGGSSNANSPSSPPSSPSPQQQISPSPSPPATPFAVMSTSMSSNRSSFGGSGGGGGGNANTNGNGNGNDNGIGINTVEQSASISGGKLTNGNSSANNNNNNQTKMISSLNGDNEPSYQNAAVILAAGSGSEPTSITSANLTTVTAAAMATMTPPTTPPPSSSPSAKLLSSTVTDAGGYTQNGRPVTPPTVNGNTVPQVAAAAVANATAAAVAAINAGSTAININEKTPGGGNNVNAAARAAAGNQTFDELYDVPARGVTPVDLPPGVKYRVKATYKYVKEDSDELSFDVGDIIQVIEYDDPDDQEEGWLMGTKEGTTEKGLFPANFTKVY